MCGFAGIIAWEDRYRFDRAALERMSARIAHRGPDGQGLWINHESEITPARPQVGLAHRRLAIIDLDERANQPFTDGQGHWLIYNGEIYNYKELRRELEQLLPNYPWRTQSDTEVLLASYVAWGEKCVEKLNGMFAFAIWDENKNELFLARDRMGQKPLYYAIDQRGAIAFASELPALQELDWVDRRMDALALKEYLCWGYVGAPRTIHNNICQELPSFWSRYSFPFKQAIGEYFDPNVGDEASQPASAAATRERVLQAVRRQLIADVPLGCFLSGGVDSSVIAASMTAVAGSARDVHTFSVGFDDPRYDERAPARQVAAHLGTRHTEFLVTPKAAEDLPKLANAFGQPFADSSALPTYYLARETRTHVKVALSGDGGDELFGGYDRYRAMAIGERMRRFPSFLRRFITSAASQALPGIHPKSRAARLKRLLGSLDRAPGARYASYIALFDQSLVRELLGKPDDPAGPAAHIEADFNRLSADRDPVQTALAVDRVSYLPNDLLTKLDRASMLHALEVRSPFMDHHLVQFAATLTTPQLLKGGPNRMLREAFAGDLPPWVFKRKKMGFAVPIGEWFRGQLRPMLRDHLFAADSFAAAHFHMPVVQRLVDEHEQQRQDHSQRLYALLMLELWWKTSGKP